MLKKVLCGVAALTLTILEHVILGVSLMDVLSTLILTFGFTYTISVWYEDFIEDKKCTTLMWVVYGAMLVCSAFLGAMFIVNKVWCLIVAAIFALAAVVCYLIEKHGLKAKEIV